MLWTVLLIILIAAIGGLLWFRHRQEREWQMEMTYLRRHQNERPDLPDNVKEAKEIRGAGPNLQNSRDTRKAAEESQAVYERTVEKLREVAPKRVRKLDALMGKLDPEEQGKLDELPIFADMQNRESGFAEVPDMDSSTQAADRLRQMLGRNPVRTSSNHLSIASYLAEHEEEQSAFSHSKHMTAFDGFESGLAMPRAVPDIVDFDMDPKMLRKPHKPAPDLPVITLEEATRSPWIDEPERPQFEQAAGYQDSASSEPRKTITLDDPAVVRTRARTLAEVNKLYIENYRPEAHEMRHLPSKHTVINETDIQTNLQWQRVSHYNRRHAQALSEHPGHQNPDTIPLEEIFFNSVRNGLPAGRRFRRASSTGHESVIPETTRIEQAQVTQVQRPRPMVAAGLNKPAAVPLYKTRNVEKPAQQPAISTPPAPNATVVEPPPVPETPKPVVDIPEPPVFNRDSHPVQAAAPVVNAHITDSPDSLIRERLISESAPEITEPVALQAGSNQVPESYETDSQNDTGLSENPVLEQASGMVPQHEHHAEHVQTGMILPDVSLLLPPQFDAAATQSEEAMLENSITIEEKLAEFKVKVKVLDAYAGPVITRYEIEPDVGVRGNAVLNLEKDLARSLGVASIRVVETIPGKTCMGLELPNPRRQVIRLSEIFNSAAFRDSSSKLTLALGQDITGQPVVTDLAKAPHLLVAGTTGSGKSVGVNAMILSMLFKASPEDVRMIMIDPKMLELSIYEGIPHLLAPVVTDMKLAANALNWCVNEMEKRYRLMSHLGVRNLAGFNQKIVEAASRGEKITNPFTLTPDDPEPLEKLPFIVVVVDEFADLMMTAGKKIEELIARLAQKARAAGIHLILATQRPSVDVITGLIKANIPTRIAFQVSSKVDSRTILDQMGAENLLGQGDMLFLPPGTGYPKRVHGAFVQDSEVHAVAEYLKQFGEPDYIDDILSAGVGGDDVFSNAPGGNNDRDELYDEAVATILRTQKPSISNLQRHLRIGYNRAATLFDMMEANGVISAAEPNGKRTILAQSSAHLD
ncbi:DNA translocase FtsK [Neisseria canis]|uniref:Cell-division protein n=1 Tax=Neisseria canis TaxID=493 RepID=A0A1X3CYT6_9NEIS|nr:DNA translocase FtsK [Neisseria canis]OSI12662.1 cell division protein FtsK [Neisseria canis]VEF02693.1 cell-division protein [Neisseria canis]